jgi:hypothetical protein
MITVKSSGSWQFTQDFLRRMQSGSYLTVVEKYGALGVTVLKAATPEESGKTAEGWYYEIERKPGYFSIHWLNSHVVQPGNIPVAVLIQYGHGTKEGVYVHGVDYINPALRPIFDQIAADMWREVTK